MTRFPDRPAGRPFRDEYDGRLTGRTGPAARVAAPASRAAARPAPDYVAGLRPDLDPGGGTADVRARRDAVVARLQDGWSQRGEELEVVRNRHGSDVFPVVGELLVAPSTWQDIRAEATAAGVEEVDLGHPELAGRVVRLRARDPRRARRLSGLVSSLRARGHAVSPSYVTPLGGGPIMKPTSGAFAPQVATFGEYAQDGPRHGDGVVVSVIDTGITAEDRADGWLAAVGRVAADDDATHDAETNVDPLDAEPHDGYLDVYAGHGTFVAGIVAQVAPGAEIRVYKAVGPGGAGSELDVACALIRAVRDGAHVVNLSLGTQTLFDEPSLPLGAALDVVREIEDDRGWQSVIVSSAGNYGDDTPTWPAAFGRVVAVGGLTADLRPTTWSSRGSWVDLSAVGEGVLSTFVQGRQNPAFGADPKDFGPSSFARWVGTSFAAPQVSGAVARTMTELGVDGPRAVHALLAAGKPVAGFGKALQILPGA
ncbi:S8 family peptidase [Cellulomonas sp. zg-ZUI222]|uniref:S8 family peptidase n=1 Tax=Cellulomonas wangleii TaxID=2816956 RepID=A0ABX8D4T9_9CELL|nr:MULTISPECIES: S8/S53 family peptidase [Cellulomonas]MBO0899621.1 S8 family peptidase [Cellulomonas sp. zg-ZUI22]MBO0920483.1 S8 family peptidase [Cellulomonas wangleii]MBO0923099.1 S8 family peptidase [Cellulomonas wangleii]QVI61481.1 S8 family peptidase [Cellulomonas wangleii]